MNTLGQLHVEKLGRAPPWLDTGTFESLLEASQFIRTIQEHQGYLVACLEEIAFQAGWIGKADLQTVAAEMGGNAYAQYSLRLSAAL